MPIAAKTQALTAASFGAVGIPADATITGLRLRVLRRSTGTDVRADVCDDLARFTLLGVDVGSELAALELVPDTLTAKEYSSSIEALGITRDDLESGRVGARLGWKSLPEDGSLYDPEDWTVDVSPDSPDGTGPVVATHVDRSTTFVVEPTRPTLQPNYVIVNLTLKSSVAANAGVNHVGTATANNGISGTVSGTLNNPGSQLVVDNGTKKVRFDLPGAKEFTVGGFGDISSYDRMPKLSVDNECSGVVVTPDAATLRVDAVQLIIDYTVPVPAEATPQGLGLGRFGGAIDIAAVIGRAVWDWPSSVLAAPMGADERGNRAPGLVATGDWSIWQYAKWLFYAHPTDGVYRREIGLAGWEPIYQDAQSPGSTGDASVALGFPPYSNEAVFDSGADSAALGTYSTNWPAPGINAGINASKGEAYVFIEDHGPYESGFATLEVTLAETRDWSHARSLVADMEQGNEDWTEIGDDSFDTRQTWNYLEIEDDASNIATYPALKFDGQNLNANQFGTYQAWFDLSTDTTVLATVKKIRIRFGIRMHGTAYYGLKALRLGGLRYRDDRAWPFVEAQTSGDKADGDVEYAYRVREDAFVGQARTLVVPDEKHLGLRVKPALAYSGSQLTIIVPRGDAPFTNDASIELFRKDAAGTWRLIATGDNDADLIHDDLLATTEIASLDTPDPALSFDDVPPAVSGVVQGIICGCSWKGSNVYSHLNGSIYFSRTNKPTEVLWDDVVLTNDVGSADLGPPRTSTLADDTVSPAICMVAAENLYCFTRTECYVFVSGDTAATASFPRKIDGVRGAVGPRAACAFGDRALAGGDDGLWALKKSTDAGEQPDELVELTSEIRGSWRSLLGTSPQTLVVSQCQGEIWVFNGNAYLHRRRDGRWIEGAWADGRTVFAATSDPSLGLVLLMGDGHLGLIGDFPSDGGTTVAGDDGEAFRWEFTSPRIDRAMDPLRAILRVQSDGGTVNVVTEAETEEGSSSVAVTSEGTFSKPFERVPAGASRLGGGWSEFHVSGGGSDRVTSLQIEVTDRDESRSAR